MAESDISIMLPDGTLVPDEMEAFVGDHDAVASEDENSDSASPQP